VNEPNDTVADLGARVSARAATPALRRRAPISSVLVTRCLDRMAARMRAKIKFDASSGSAIDSLR
jgi:hypothetical protein